MMSDITRWMSLPIAVAMMALAAVTGPVPLHAQEQSCQAGATPTDALNNPSTTELLQGLTTTLNTFWSGAGGRESADRSPSRSRPA
jgi:hypothetical protein